MNQLSKNDIINCDISGYSSSGDGIARVDGMVIFVKGALRGENCDIRILKVNKNAVFAKAEEIINPSPARREPECTQFSKCGGCDLMHMSYDEELFLKHQRVEDAIRRIGGIDTPIDDIIGADSTTGYRNKVIYAVGGTAAEPEIGFYRSRSHDIVSASGCLIQPQVAENAATAVKSWMQEHSVDPYDEKSGKGLIRHIFIRHGFGTGETAVCIVVNGKSIPQSERLISGILSACPTVRSIVLNTNKSRVNTVLGVKFTTLWGSDYIEDTLCGLKFRLSPPSFYQINRNQAERLYNIVLQLSELKGHETVLDLYCGTGTITLHLARHAKKVIGAEIVSQATQDAVKNAEINAITNSSFITADASQAAAELAAQGLHPDLIVVDPPRKGLASDVIETICSMSPEKVIYVSCDPATLSRDLKIFNDLSYKTKRIVPVDMFPRCAHVETIVLLQRQHT